MPVSYSPSLNVSDSPSKSPDERFFSGGGGGGGGPALLVYDSFTDPNSTALTAHSPDTNITGATWQNFGTLGTRQITGNAAQLYQAKGMSYFDASGYDSVILEATHPSAIGNANQTVSLGLRDVDVDNYFSMYVFSNAYRIREWTGGSVTNRATQLHTWAATDSFWASDDGNTISAGDNRSAATISYSSTQHNSSKLYGLESGSTSSTRYNDDFILMGGTTDPNDLYTP